MVNAQLFSLLIYDLSKILTYGTKYSRMDQIKFVVDSLQKV